MAMKNILEKLDNSQKDILNMNSCEYFYLNGIKLDISFNDKKPPNPIQLNFIKEHLKETYPEDIVFLDNEGEVIKKEDEDNIFIVVNDVTLIHHIFLKHYIHKKIMKKKILY